MVAETAAVGRRIAWSTSPRAHSTRHEAVFRAAPLTPRHTRVTRGALGFRPSRAAPLASSRPCVKPLPSPALRDPTAKKTKGVGTSLIGEAARWSVRSAMATVMCRRDVGRSGGRLFDTIMVIALVVPIFSVTCVAQGMTPVGDVKDHPVPTPSPSKSHHRHERGGTDGGRDAGAADAVDLDGVPQESMQSLFNWAIENSDPEKLREMAAAAEANRDAHASSLPDAGAASKVQPGQRWTEEEVLQKRRDVKEVLDMMKSNPTEHDVVKLATEMYVNRSLPTTERLRALEELDDLVRPVDIANDLHVMGALAPLVHTALDAKEDEDVRAAALKALSTAMSNNAKVQSLVHAWRPSTSKNIATAATSAPEAQSTPNAESSTEDDSTDNERKRRLAAAANAKGLYGTVDTSSPVVPAVSVEAKLAATAKDDGLSVTLRVKALSALATMTRNTLACRRVLFASGGSDTLRALMREGSPEALRRKALVLLTDFWVNRDSADDGEAVSVAAAAEEKRLAVALMPDVVNMLWRGTADEREKAMDALRAALTGSNPDDQQHPPGKAPSYLIGWRSAEVAEAATKIGAMNALKVLGEYFWREADAADDSDLEFRNYMLDLQQEALALHEALKEFNVKGEL